MLGWWCSEPRAVAQDLERPVARAGCRFYSFGSQRLSSNALLTTLTLDSAIAAPATTDTIFRVVTLVSTFAASRLQPKSKLIEA